MNRLRFTPLCVLAIITAIAAVAPTVAQAELLPGPTLTSTGNTLHWTEVAGSSSYKVYQHREGSSTHTETTIGNVLEYTPPTDPSFTDAYKVKSNLSKWSNAVKIAYPVEEPPPELVTYSPTITPLSSAEIPNSGRGMYDWEGEYSMRPKAEWPLEDYYQRDEIEWKRDLETSKGVYPFLTTPGIIDTGIAKAEAKGGRLRFRVMAWIPGGSNRYPSYIESETNSCGTFPKWNSESWLSAWDNLWKALGEKYGSNPRIGWVDVGGYGAWGEWHMNGCVASGSHITTANGERMVKAVVTAFPKAHAVLGTSAAIKEEAPIQPELLKHATAAQPTLGYHFDNYGAEPCALGNNLVYAQPGGACGKTTGESPEVWARWNAASVVAENANKSATWTIAEAKKSEEIFHVSLIGSGNNTNKPWEGHAAEWEEILKRAGFRDQLKSVTLPGTVTRGAAFNLEAKWENVNVAPTYDPWTLEWELRNGAGEVVWSASSSYDLRTLEPTGGTPTAHTDSVTVPTPVVAGTYTLDVVAKDPSGYLPPLHFADEGRGSGGDYPLGSVTLK